MKILVIGGTYFLGKAFVELACETEEMTLLNRGSRNPVFSHPEHIERILSDRHALTAETMAGRSYDAVVDFCAYEKGDIAGILEALQGRTRQYVFISTCDVYRRGTGKAQDESGPLETRDFGGMAGAYILGKAALENELQEMAEKWKIGITSIRPPFLYGPGNYAAREDLFFNWIVKAGQILYPEDATGSFQMVYVEDAAAAILKICGKKEAYGQSLNLPGAGTVTYESFCRALEAAVEKPFEKIPVSVETIQQKQIPLPFPLTREESEAYVTGSSLLKDMPYRTLEEGLALAFAYWKDH